MAAPPPRGINKLPSFSDVPQGDLLAKAFMTFLHSISAVFRDPAFVPLMHALDQHFDVPPSSQAAHLPPHSHHQYQRGSSEDVPPSPPTTPNQEAGPKDSPHGLTFGMSAERGVMSEGASDEDVAKMISK